MALIHPFRALRPVPARAAAVSSVPYDVVSTEEARELARNNPFSFLRVTRSEIDLPPDADPYAARVYQRARENFQKLRETAPLVLEDTPSLYFYRLKMGQHEQTGLAGCFSVDEYERDIIKKHERTRRDKEDDRTRHIIELRAQTGIVFLVYRGVSEVDEISRRVSASEPLYDFTADDAVQHTVWRAAEEDARALVAAFAKIPSLYIADGHHRAASAARARDEMRGRPGVTPEVGTFIAVAFPDKQVQILPYNRTVKDLGGRTSAQFLKMLRDRLPVAEGSAAPRRKGEVAMYLERKWYSVDLTRAQPADVSHGSRLDVSLLQRAVLEQLLNVGDVRSDKRIDFIGGARGAKALETAVDSGKAALAFSLFPVTVEDLIAISDAGGIMPPKSTWFEPKLRDGLLVHVI
jgi:uncharacterized protein (DUF1015 family)